MPFASPFAAFRAGSLFCAFAALLLAGAAPKPPALKPLVSVSALKTPAAPAPVAPRIYPSNVAFVGPAAPFVLKAKSPADRERAVTCLAQAVYYEAARESDEGQAAVAQVVLNRMRHPQFPKSVCGVVFQGASLNTGCQFSFTCDGSLAYRPEADVWERARAVAERALNGYVVSEVGTSTHYHADYVDPYWAPTVAKITQIGAHIFYRWQGERGMPEAFQGHYAGVERAFGGFSLAVLTRAARKAEPKPAKAVETLADGRVHGVIQAEAPLTPRDRFRALGAAGQLGAAFAATDYAAAQAQPVEAVKVSEPQPVVAAAAESQPVG